MDLDRIKALYQYNRWANAKVFDTVSTLKLEEYSRDLKSSYRSVRDTMVHIISAEWIWLTRLRGTSPKAMWLPSDFPTVLTLRSRWESLAQEQAEYMGKLTEESLSVLITYVNTRGETYTYPLWQILQHVVNHSSYHRGQITTMLRQLGAEPVATDFLLYYDMVSELAE
ncbi:MAG: DinB family protein [Ignavibacteriae bacterium]|nr:DinB family protein [Ignavibacteriota bacterium]